MKFKKITAIICAAALILSLAACAKKADYSGTTVVGKVTAADGNKVTVSIGTLDESADNTAQPDSDGTGDSQTPPDMPDSDSQTPPDMSGGSSVTFTESGDTAEIDLSAATVTENGNTVSVSDIEVGDILKITFNDKNTAETVEIVSVSSKPSGTGGGQTLDGNISVDTISTLNMTLKNGSTFTGTVNIRDNAEGGTAVSDNAVITVEEGCVWNLTGNCTVTSVTNNGTINFNGYTITLADGTVLK